MSDITKDDFKESIFNKDNEIKYICIDDSKDLKEFELIKKDIFRVIINEKNISQFVNLDYIKDLIYKHRFDKFKRVEVEYKS